MKILDLDSLKDAIKERFESDSDVDEVLETGSCSGEVHFKVRYLMTVEFEIE